MENFKVQFSSRLVLTERKRKRENLFIYLFTKYRKRDRALAGLPRESTYSDIDMSYNFICSQGRTHHNQVETIMALALLVLFKLHDYDKKTIQFFFNTIMVPWAHIRYPASNGQLM